MEVDCYWLAVKVTTATHKVTALHAQLHVEIETFGFRLLYLEGSRDVGDDLLAEVWYQIP